MKKYILLFVIFIFLMFVITLIYRNFFSNMGISDHDISFIVTEKVENYKTEELGRTALEISIPDSWEITGVNSDSTKKSYVDEIKVFDLRGNQISIIARREDPITVENMRVSDENARKGIYPEGFTGYIGYQDLPQREWYNLDYYICDLTLLKIGEIEYCRSPIQLDSDQNKYFVSVYVVKDLKVTNKLETKDFTYQYDYIQIYYDFKSNPYETTEYNYKQVLEEFDKATISLLKSADE
jgi:hypothetical protein